MKKLALLLLPLLLLTSNLRADVTYHKDTHVVATASEEGKPGSIGLTTFSKDGKLTSFKVIVKGKEELVFKYFNDKLVSTFVIIGDRKVSTEYRKDGTMSKYIDTGDDTTLTFKYKELAEGYLVDIEGTLAGKPFSKTINTNNNKDSISPTVDKELRSISEYAVKFYANAQGIKKVFDPMYDPDED